MESPVAIDATAAAAEAEVNAAEGALKTIAGQDPTSWWSAYDLKVCARNGWSAAAMSVALNRLISDGTFELTDGDRVRLSQ